MKKGSEFKCLYHRRCCFTKEDSTTSIKRFSLFIREGEGFSPLLCRMVHGKGRTSGSIDSTRIRKTIPTEYSEMLITRSLNKNIL